MARALLALALAFLLFSGQALARSALSPRYSGTEPRDGPRRLDVLPGNGPGRTAEGGMGYQDAYGRTLTDKMPEEKKPRARPRPGAYGAPPAKSAPLPDLPDRNSPPVWSFK